MSCDASSPGRHRGAGRVAAPREGTGGRRHPAGFALGSRSHWSDTDVHTGQRVCRMPHPPGAQERLEREARVEGERPRPRCHPGRAPRGSWPSRQRRRRPGALARAAPAWRGRCAAPYLRCPPWCRPGKWSCPRAMPDPVRGCSRWSSGAESPRRGLASWGPGYRGASPPGPRGPTAPWDSARAAHPGALGSSDTR